MRRTLLFLAAAATFLQPVWPAFADIAFPARLDVVESEQGSYEVSFTLPLIEGRKLRAEPVMPPTCHDLSAPQVTVSSAGHNTTWIASCEPASLAGEAILVNGLLGTQTDLAFSLTTLDGRVYSEILRPSRPGFLVPEPPSLLGLGAEAAVAGLRRAVRQPALWLLLLVATLLGARHYRLISAAAVFAIAHGLGQWLGGKGWLHIDPAQRDLFVLATIALPAVALAGAGERWRGWLRPLWPTAALVGLLYGGASPETLPSGGLSDLEKLLALLFFALGVALGVVLMVAAAVEIHAVLRGRWRAPALRWIGYAVGALAVGGLLAVLISMTLLPGGGRGAPLELVLMAALLGPTLAAVGRGSPWWVLPFGGLAAVGVTAALQRLPLPLDSTLVVGTLLLLGGALAANKPLPGRLALLVAAVAIPAHSWSATQTLVENVSRSTGAALGAAVVALCVFYASLALTRGARVGALPFWVRFLGAVVALVALAARMMEYRDLFDRQLATELALGLFRLPVLALVLLAAAVLVWPRRRRVVEALGLEHRPRVAHWVLLGAAWLALPYGTVALRNPFFEPHAPRGDDARRVATRVLSDTYQAFNLEDEDELYDRLADTVTGELIDDLYLDSRRRLEAGTREGAQVTVRDVRVLEIGPPEGDQGAGAGFAYLCRWMVTARVQHLQHVHHRRNIYNGVLTLRADGERWKIAGVELRSEEREVVPWTPT